MWYRIIPNIVQHLLWIPVRFVLATGYGYRVYGRKNLRTIDPSRGVIFACNHAAKIDPVVMIAALSPLSRFYPIFSVTMLPEEYLGHGLVRYLMGPVFTTLYGGFPVQRGLKNYDKALRHHIKILKEKGSVLIFIEGKMTKDGNLGGARPGIGYLAEATNAVVVPVALSGTYNHSAAKGISRSQRLSVTFGKPLDVKELIEDAPLHHPDRLYHIANQIRDGIAKLLPRHE